MGVRVHELEDRLIEGIETEVQGEKKKKNGKK